MVYKKSKMVILWVDIIVFYDILGFRKRENYMKIIDKQNDNIDKIREEVAQAKAVLADWGCSDVDEKFKNGVLIGRSGLKFQSALKLGVDTFGSEALALESEPRGQVENAEPLHSEMILSSTDFSKWANFGFPTVIWGIKTNKTRRTITFQNDGNISLHKEGKSWPRKKDALVSYDGFYDVSSRDVSMSFAVNKKDGEVAPLQISVSLKGDILTIVVGEYTMERNLVTGITSSKILIVDPLKRKTLEAKFASYDGYLQSGFLRAASLDENGKVTDSISIASDEEGRRSIKSVPVIGRPKEDVLYDQIAERIEELVPDSYKTDLLDYVNKAKYVTGPIVISLDGLLEMENRAIEMLGGVRGELILEGLTSRVDALINTWKKENEYAYRKPKTLQPIKKQ